MTLFMYSYFGYNLPRYFTDYFKSNEMIHSHNARTASNIYVDYKKDKLWEFSLKFSGGQIWNKLPKDLKELKSYIYLKN